MRIICGNETDRKIITGLFIFLIVFSLLDFINIKHIPKDDFGLFIFGCNIILPIVMYLILIAFIEK